MFLVKKIRGSSIAEVVIAMSIIALCIAIASLVFIRSTKSGMNFQDVRLQTELQSEIWRSMHFDLEEITEIEGSHSTVNDDISNDSIMVYQFTGGSDDEIWIQQWEKE